MKNLTDKEVLQEAIGIAEDNDDNYECSGSDRLMALLPVANEIDYRGIIFSHDFAKSFFGEEILEDYHDNFGNKGGERLVKHGWQYHLQQMVLCSNPIDYLRKFLDNTENPLKK